MFGSGLRAILGPLNFLFRDSKLPEACKIMHDLADYYVNKALRWRQECMSQERSRSTDEDVKDRRQQHILLHGMAEQIDDRTDLRNQIFSESRPN